MEYRLFVNFAVLAILYYSALSFSTCSGLDTIDNPITATTNNNSAYYANIENRMKDLVYLYCVTPQRPNGYRFTNNETDNQIKDIFSLERLGIFVHGFNNDQDISESLKEVRGSWNQSIPNVCTFIWTELSGPPFSYLEAVKYNIRLCANFLADTIKRFIDLKVADAASTDLAGHSLGAHIVSYAAKRLKELYNYIIHTLFGLDPNQPGTGKTAPYTISEGFITSSPISKYTVCYQTDSSDWEITACNCINIVVNLPDAQPGCIIPNVTQLTGPNGTQALYDYIGCSHVYALRLFTDLLPPSRHCDARNGEKTIPVGYSDTLLYDTCPNKSYCLVTNPAPPFCPAKITTPLDLLNFKLGSVCKTLIPQTLIPKPLIPHL